MSTMKSKSTLNRSNLPIILYDLILSIKFISLQCIHTVTVVECDADGLWVMLGTDILAKPMHVTSCVSVR